MTGADVAAVIVAVVVAAVAGRWLAETLERTALVAGGPVAGEPALARAAATALALPPVSWMRPTPRRPAQPAAPPRAASAGSASAPRAPASAAWAVSAREGPGRAASARSGPVQGVEVGIAAAALGGAVAWAVGAAAELPGMLFLAALGLVLSAVDVRTHRLPDALTLPAYPILAILLGAGALLVGVNGDVDAAQPLRAAEAGLVAFGVLYLLAIAVPAGFGYGDVKLAGLLGAALGWYGWSAVFAGLVYGFVYGGLCAAALLTTRRLARTDRLAFGPFLLAGTLTAIVLSP